MTKQARFRKARSILLRKRRPRTVKSTNLMKLGKNLQFKPYDYVRYYTSEISLANSAGGAENGIAIEFKLDSISLHTDFTVLYDQFRILKADVEIRPARVFNTIIDATTGTAMNTALVPDVYSFIDIDDSIAPTIATCLQRGDAVRRPATAQYKRVVNFPRVNTLVYKTASTESYAASKPGMWLDMADPGVPHYGLKLAMSGSGSTTRLWEIRCIVRLWFQCRNSK